MSDKNVTNRKGKIAYLSIFNIARKKGHWPETDNA